MKSYAGPPLLFGAPEYAEHSSNREADRRLKVCGISTSDKQKIACIQSGQPGEGASELINTQEDISDVVLIEQEPEEDIVGDQMDEDFNLDEVFVVKN